MTLATLDRATTPSLLDVVDGLAARTGAWVVIERFGVVVTHGAGAGPCPEPLASSLLSKSTAALRAAVRWKRSSGTLENRCVTAAELGDGVTAWFIGAVVDDTAIAVLSAAAHSSGPVTDPAIEELLHPRGPARRGRAPRARLVALRSVEPGLARLAVVAVAGTDARVHQLDDVVLVALPPDGDVEQLVARLGCSVVAGVADVVDEASDWVSAAALAAAAARAACDLGLVIGRPSDPAVAGELVVTEAQAAVADLVRALPDAPLRRLQEHDARSGGELVASLTAWCRAGFDVPAAAAALHVHTNTLRYRLKRATEVCGLDVTRPRQLLALQLLLQV